jgi:hypothetical protein
MTGGFLLAALAMGATLPLTTGAERTEQSVVQLRIPAGGGEALATAVVVHREEREDRVHIFLLTSARVASAMPGTTVLRTRGVPLDENLDAGIAVLRLSLRHSLLAPAPVTFDMPPPGAGFRVAGVSVVDGTARVVGQQVRAALSGAVLGSADLSALAGCIGAPAISDGGVFGIVSECEGGHPPIVTPLAGARTLLLRQIPDLETQTDETPKRSGEEPGQ